jgi:ABC-2 type transport system ATP-binding protein
VIEVKNLTKIYGNHVAVDDISFNLEPGKIYGFLGPNGAGKSTTMNIMTGYIAATGGEVIINGHNILDEPEEAKACIGYLPELPPLYMEMTVEEYLRFAAKLKKIKRSEQAAAVEEVIELTKLGEYRKRLIANLSKGYKQRVGLAQAVLGMPEIIILDEPTVGLDPRQIIEIRDMIKTLSKDHTVILSSHILQEISAVCDHILIIARGHLVASDTPENLVKQYTEKKQMKLLVKGTIPEVKDTLSRIEGIRSSSVLENFREVDSVDVTLELSSDTDIREELFNAFAEDGLPILSMVNYEPTLEDIFMELTGIEEQKAIAREEEATRLKMLKKQNRFKHTHQNEETDDEDEETAELPNDEETEEPLEKTEKEDEEEQA